MSLLQPSGLERSAGLLFPRGKSRQKRAGETPAPSFCPIGRKQGGFPAATEFLPSRWPLVIGSVHYALRLPALGLRVVSIFVDESLCGFHRCRQLVTENQIRSSLQQGVSRSRTRSPAEIRCEKTPVQWLRSGKSAQTDWAKIGVRGVPGGVLVTLPPRAK